MVFGLVIIGNSQAQTVFDSLKGCGQVENSLKRLICYDDLVERMKLNSDSEQLVETVVPVLTNKPSPPSTKKSVPSSRSDDDYFGKEQDKVKELKTEDKIYATVVNIGIDAKRKRLISLSNGHIWRELSDVRLKLKVKDSIYIERGILGSFFLGKTNENSRIKVRRVD